MTKSPLQYQRTVDLRSHRCRHVLSAPAVDGPHLISDSSGHDHTVEGAARLLDSPQQFGHGRLVPGVDSGHLEVGRSGCDLVE